MDSAHKDERAIFKAALKKKLLTERAAYIKTTEDDLRQAFEAFGQVIWLKLN